jgi:2-polyprenyl-6-methoxyphenol hydroxylase-like FAD-dependent oxidoreductase
MMTGNGQPIATDSGNHIVVVGGGPGGCATAIWCALRQLSVTLIEARKFPRHRPGETLHPGVEPILRQLGVAEQVAVASSMRHEGQHVHWGGED